MNLTMAQTFLNRRVTLELVPCHPGRTEPFVLDGFIVQADESGLLFKTPVKTAYIAYAHILKVNPHD